MDLAASPIRTIEPLLAARLRLAFPQKDFSLERIPAVLTVKEFERVLRQPPFLGLAFLGIKPDANSGRQLQAKMRWRLILVVKASRDLCTRFSGDAHEIGLDAMTDVAVALLQGAAIEEVGDVSVTSVEAVYAEGWGDDATVVNQVDFEVAFSSSPAAFRLVAADDLVSIGATWLIADSADPEEGPAAPQEIQLGGEGA
ncbi:hypothetical protein [Afifella pfennigii]|uniref:hypothetical protein n=1 Tax=Afifella pfennigii TaxID=209897 RepID=UPI000478A26F|nr:hypothetical protein [Afifella pfennigii]